LNTSPSIRRRAPHESTFVELLLSHPNIGVRTEAPVIRRANTSPYPYLIFYEIADDEVIVHAVRHGARNPSSMHGAS
jgi:toxin ParE1/3/4